MLRLLVALDFSDCSVEALRAALAIAERAHPAELVCLTVLQPLDEASAQSPEALGELEGAISTLHDMVNAEKTARASKPDALHVHFTATRGTPADEITEQARVHNADAIVMGTHGRTGLDRLLVGSVAEKVVRQAPCSVLTVKPKKTA